ncbi:heme ABC transporter permease, partial [Salmonella enterica]|nr:heme ABC transporter permease [Salmonella enterica]
RFATRWSRIFYVAAVPVLLLGMWQGLFVVPAEQTQNDAFRIIYIHVPSAWMSLFVFALMAFYAVIALVWRIKICEILAMACAPMGAGFT